MGFIWYRTSGIYGIDDIPNTPEAYTAHVDALKWKADRRRNNFYTMVFGVPALVFVLSWMLFLVGRAAARWVRAGFKNGGSPSETVGPQPAD